MKFQFGNMNKLNNKKNTNNNNKKNLKNSNKLDAKWL